jgi:hypothetical protein
MYDMLRLISLDIAMLMRNLSTTWLIFTTSDYFLSSRQAFNASSFSYVTITARLYDVATSHKCTMLTQRQAYRVLAHVMKFRGTSEDVGMSTLCNREFSIGWYRMK